MTGWFWHPTVEGRCSVCGRTKRGLWRFWDSFASYRQATCAECAEGES